MSDMADVMRARREAADALGAVLSYGAAIEEGRYGDPAVAIMLAAGAVCAEISALATTLDYASGRVTLNV